jgi:hypothetical protein
MSVFLLELHRVDPPEVDSEATACTIGKLLPDKENVDLSMRDRISLLVGSMIDKTHSRMSSLTLMVIPSMASISCIITIEVACKLVEDSVVA